MTRPEPSDLLGVARNAAADEIRRAFAAAVRQIHPDAASRETATASRPDVAERLAHLIEARDELLAALARPTEPSAPPTSYRSLTRLQRAARVLGRLLYVSPHPSDRS